MKSINDKIESYIDVSIKEELTKKLWYVSSSIFMLIYNSVENLIDGTIDDSIGNHHWMLYGSLGDY